MPSRLIPCRQTTLAGCLMVLNFHAVVLSNTDVALAENPLRVTVEAERITVLAGEQPILTYRYSQVPYKPYIQRLSTPAGINILRDAPHDHLHHHGVMFALMVDGVDFWGEVNTPKPGLEVHRDLMDVQVDSRSGMNRAIFSELLDWTTSTDPKTLLQEWRSITAYQAKDLAASLLTWESELSLPAGKQSAEITGRSYFGLGMRFIQSMDIKGQFVNAERKTGVDGTNGKQSKWCAYTADADGRTVTVAMFDHPDNMRHPACWFTMLDPFSYLSATLDVHHKAITLTRSKTLKLRYGLALWDGKVEPEQIEELYGRWISLTAAATRPET